MGGRRGISQRPGKYGGKRGDREGERYQLPVRRGFVLTVVSGVDPGKEYFFEDTAAIGRIETSDIVLVEPGISRTHARIYEEQGLFFIEDLKSANGTRLNGQLLTEAEVLRDGDYVTLSQTTFQFSLLDATRGEPTGRPRLSTGEAQAADFATRTRTVRLGHIGRLVRTPRGRLVVVLLLVVLGALGAYGLWGRRTKTSFFDQSTSPLTYSDENEFFNAVFGFGAYDRSHLTQLMVNFEYLGGRATLQYGASGIDKTGEVNILLNGDVVGQVPLTLEKWVYGLKLVLPREKLKKNQRNQVVFHNTRNPPAKDPWQICYLQIIQEAIPPPDPQEAALQFELAKKAWEDREIEPSNMYTALLGFKRARDLLEGAPQRTDLYQEALDYIEKVDQALTRKFDEGQFSARRAEKVDGDPEKARSVLIRTLRYFRREDFRYREIQRYLDALSGSVSP
jgi:pSer/pThr/pTyr-binding forkhead associated (FHA) protein